MYGTLSNNESILINEQGSYILSNKFNQRTYAISGEELNLDSLKYAYDTTEMKFDRMAELKVIHGYNCRKIKISMLDLSNGIGRIINSYFVWFTDEIQANHYLPLFIGEFPCTNGLILEYDYPRENGHTIVTAKNVSIQSVPQSVFHPNLTTYNLIYNGN